MRQRWGLGLLALYFTIAGAAASAWAAPPAVDIQTVRVGYASNEKPNQFKIGAWVPVWVQLGAGADGFKGVLEVTVADDAGTPVAFHQPIALGPKQTGQRFVSYARPGDRNPEFTVRVLDERGKRAANEYNTTSTGMALNPVQPDGTLLITLGKPSGVELIPTLPDFNATQSQGMSETAVGTIDTFAGAALPGRWYGYDAATAVVLDTGDRDAMRALENYRGAPLAEWVKRGGHLVVAVGRDWQAARGSFLGPMLPAEPTAQVKVNSLEALDAYAGSGGTKHAKQITPPGSAPVMITKLENVAREAKVLAATGDLPLVVRGPYGFGRVTVVALDVDQKPFATWDGRASFWVRAIDLRRPSADLAGTNPRVMGGRIYQSGVSDLASTLRKALDQFPGVRLVPFGWVAFFIFLYILLIGPGDYFFLKKVVKRMELTWVTFPLIVVTVSLVAYYGAYVVKGNELRVNKVDVVDVDQEAGILRGSSWVNVFSPQNRDYDVALVPERLDVNAPPADPKSPAERVPGADVVLSWFAAPEVGFGGMGGQGRMNFASGGYTYAPVNTAESLKNVRVPIWSTKCFTARWFAPTPGLIDADLKPVGVDRVEGTLANRTGGILHDAVLVHRNQVYTLKTIAPGATVRVNPTETRFLSGRLNEISRKYNLMNGYQSNVYADRAELAFDLMFHDSRPSASAEATLTSNPLHYLDLSGQLDLGRPMLVARLDRPAARLALGNAPSTPKIDEVATLRVVLPLK